MSARTHGIPLVALGLVTTSCFGKAEDDDDEDWSDIPLLGEDGAPGSGDGGDAATGDGASSTGGDTLIGEWLLTEVDGSPYGDFYEYDYGDCTLVYGRQVAFVFEGSDADVQPGVLELRYTYESLGDCDYDYDYSYADELRANGQRRAARTYDIAVDELGLTFSCELRSADLDDMDCDYGSSVFLFER